MAVDALVRDYPDRESARKGIRNEITVFYRDRYPELLRDSADLVERAIQGVIAIRDRSVFPAMKVDWQTYFSNIGHRHWPGCFRCHDGKHVSSDGKVLTKECTTCHTMPQRGPLKPLGEAVASTRQDWHPWKLMGKHSEILCNRCHRAGYRPPSDCATCHGMNKTAPMMKDMDCGDCHTEPQHVRPLEDCAGCHDELAGLHEKHSDTKCVTCHEPHKWKPGKDTACMKCHDDLRDHHEGEGACRKCHAFKKPAVR